MEEYAEAMGRARRELARLDPSWLANRAGASYSYPRRCFTLTFLGRRAQVSFPGGEVMLEGEPAGSLEQLVILHYLVHARGDLPERQWVAYRDLPGARYHEGAFRAEVEAPLARALEESEASIRRRVEELGLERLEYGGFSFVWEALPRVPLLFVLNPADEEFPAEARVFFDVTAPCYLPTEDLEALAGMAVRALTDFHRRPSSSRVL